MGSFGVRLRSLRVRNSLTQADLANRIGVSSTYISALEGGRKPAPPRAIVSAMATALGVSEADMWSLAQAEREERLRERIVGTPTSRREPASMEPPTNERRDSRLPSLMDQLRLLIADESTRQPLVDALTELARSLSENSDT